MTETYHGSQDRIDAITGTICLTSSYRAATEYALDKDGDYAETGLIHTVEIPAGLRIADAADLLAAAADILGEVHYTYEAADNARVQAALAAAGYAGVAYDDQTIDGTAHDTILVWDTAALTITDIETVER